MIGRVEIQSGEVSGDSTGFFDVDPIEGNVLENGRIESRLIAAEFDDVGTAAMVALAGGAAVVASLTSFLLLLSLLLLLLLL